MAHPRKLRIEIDLNWLLLSQVELKRLLQTVPLSQLHLDTCKCFPLYALEQVNSHAANLTAFPGPN